MEQGLLIMEIGFWKTLPSVDPKGFGSVGKPEKLRDRLLGILHAKLSHFAGSNYANAAKFCIERRDWNQYENWEAQSMVRRGVLHLLSRGSL